MPLLFITSIRKAKRVAKPAQLCLQFQFPKDFSVLSGTFQAKGARNSFPTFHAVLNSIAAKREKSIEILV